MKLKNKELKAMQETELKAKLEELRLELMKLNTQADAKERSSVPQKSQISDAKEEPAAEVDESKKAKETKEAKPRRARKKKEDEAEK